MKHRYSVVAGQTNIDGRLTRRPVVEVELSFGPHQRKFLALIDSGADQIMMPAAIAEAFEIDPAKCMRRSVMGVSMEPIDGFIEYLTFRVKDQEETFEAPVVFIDTDIPVLLGREGFFDQYRIKFEQDHDTFEISPVRR
jgi:NACalpha-BTF3-like transcription factor